MISAIPIYLTNTVYARKMIGILADREKFRIVEEEKDKTAGAVKKLK